MTLFSRSAVEINQGNLTLYLTYVTPRDLFSENFYTVEKLEPRTQEGFQRILDERRARRLSRHLTEANEQGYAHLPTTVFLATDKSMTFDNETGTLTFDKEQVCPFSVVDGQHRIEGLRGAVEKERELANFKLPVTIATELDDTHQMYHFFIVNTTQVPVDTSLRQQITKRFTDMQGVDDLPYTPYWLQREVSIGRDAKALSMVEYLNDCPDSPLFGRVQMANEPNDSKKIKQSSIVTMFKSEIFAASNPLVAQETDPNRQARIMLNYFRTVDNLFVVGRDRTDTVVYKSNGIFFFLGIAKWIFNVIYSSTKDFTVGSLEEVIKTALDELDDANQDLADPNWWMPGPLGASGLNRSGASQRVEAFQQALARSQQSDILL